MTHRALIIGGSIGGLFAAHLLRQAGWDALVFERVGEDLAGRGAGIGTQVALLEVMQRIGCPVDGTMGVDVRTCICLDRDGQVVHQLPIERTMSAWARFYRPLRDRLPADWYRPGCRLLRIEQDAQSVTAIFADGTRVSGDLLIGADGIRSTVRAQMAPEVQPVYAGYIAWRGMVEERDLPQHLRTSVFERYTFCLPDRELLLAYPVPARDGDTRPGRRGYNVVWYRPTDAATLARMCTDATGKVHDGAIPPPLIRPEVLADMRADARALLAPQIAGLMAVADPAFFQPIYDVLSDRIVFGRVALLGDAAFVARPHVGAGVTKAALDAACLADSLSGAGDDLAAGLARYDRIQTQFGHWIVNRSRALGAQVGGTGASRRAETVMAEHSAANANLREIAAGRAFST
jgi:2-polyprenyl-6-methoxyphenol hydroxylase-like FAD-dependent oxidoreductase